MLAEDKKRALYQALEDRILHGEGRAPTELLGKLTATGSLTAGDMREVLAAGASPQQVRDALAVCAAFNTTNRLADAFGFQVLSPEGFDAGAKVLLKRGYR